MPGRLEAWMPYIQRAPRTPKILPPWMDPSPAGDQGYDPFGTSMPFRPTHRVPGMERKSRRISFATPGKTTTFESPLTRIANALQHNFTWRFSGKNPLQSIQPAMFPLLAFAGSVLLLAFGVTFLYSNFLPKDESRAITPSSIDQTYASSNDDQSTRLSTPDPEPSPSLIDPASGDEFRSPANKEMLTGPILETHHGDPAADLPMRMGTPIYAVREGTAYIIDNAECGSGIILHGSDGNRYTYCFASELIVSNRAQVNAGDFIMRSGTPPNKATEDSAPHLHFEITVRSEKICPQEVLNEWFSNRYANPSQASTTSCLMVTHQ